MIELKLNVSEVDYNSLLKLLGGSVGSAAAMAARALPDSAKEDLAVKYLNNSAGKLEGMLENAAASKGIKLKISGAQARVIR